MTDARANDECNTDDHLYLRGALTNDRGSGFVHDSKLTQRSYNLFFITFPLLLPFCPFPTLTPKLIALYRSGPT
jgi:hypothetical protein